jgi:hypothetical protein
METTTETALAVPAATNGAQLAESALLHGDIEKMGPNQRVQYYMKVCTSLGLNPWTKPFEFLRLSGKLQLYARKDCTEQLRRLNGVSIRIVSRELVDGVYVVTAQATDRTGRVDESIGAVPVEGLKGEAKANAVMKAETKSKRRVTLSICGLGMLDESEVESVKGAEPVPVDLPPQEAPPAPAPTVDPGEPCDPAAAKSIGELAMGENGLRWAKPRAVSWLKRYFGVASTLALTADQGATAAELLKVRIKHGDEAYRALSAKFFADGRIKAESVEQG